MDKELVRAVDIYNVVCKTMSVMDPEIQTHGEITGYIFYNMLKAEGLYTPMELAEYALLGVLHDVGMFKTGYKGDIIQYEISNVWAHSVYGYLFMNYLSPVGNKAEIILYHHLPYRLHSQINSKYIKVTEYLTFADMLDVFMRMKGHGMDRDYFTRNSGVVFSPESLALFRTAQKRFQFMEKLKSGEYQQEMKGLFEAIRFSEKQKKGFLEMLVYAIDFRSQQTVIHTMSAKTFAFELGRLTRVTTMDLQILYYASLLHDIGKIVIPLEILEAPRKLTDEEMRVMKAHVVISDKILRGIMDPRIVEVAVRHHEKLDGTGYPRGLSARDLTKLERIMAVADILSALYGKRSYKDAFPSEKVKEILKSDADNGKICREIVDVAISNYDVIISKYEEQRSATMDKYMEITNRYDSIYERFKAFDK